MANRLAPPSALSLQALSDLSKAVDSQNTLPTFGPTTDAVVAVEAGQFRHLAPRAAGQNVTIPAASAANFNKRITLFVSGALGTCRVRPVSGTINGSTSFTLSAGYTTILELVSNGVNGWATIRAEGAPFGALTGEVTTIGQAATVVRSTDYSSSPWTGNHKFEQQLLLGDEQTETGTGALNVTLGAVIRLRFGDATGDHTIGTISGCANGRLLIVEFSGTGVHTTTHSASGSNVVCCPGDTNLVITGRGGYIAVGRGSTPQWKVVATTN